MIRTSWILGSMAALALAACGPANDTRTTGDETGAAGEPPVVTPDTAMAPGAGALDTGMTPSDTALGDTRPE